MNDLLVFLYWQFLVLTVMLEAEDSLLVGYRFGMCFKDQSSSMSLSLAFLVQNKADINLKYMFIMVASRAKVAPFALCLLGGSAPKPILPDLAICGCGVLLRPT